MTVERILRAKGAEVEIIPPETTVVMALHQLITKGIGALVVTSDGEHVEGVLSERDVLRGLARHGQLLFGTRVAKVMTRHAPVCAPTDSLKHVMSEMTRTRHRHLPVVEAGKLVGIISIGDVVKSRLEDLELETVVLRDAYVARG